MSPATLFDSLVDEALKSRAELSLLRPVVEKELLHHDILREMSSAGLLSGLTFIGGTCLRACYARRASVRILISREEATSSAPTSRSLGRCSRKHSAPATD